MSDMKKTLTSAELVTTYTIEEINTADSDIVDFLFSLGCYAGEKITVISNLSGQYVVSIKDGRYSIDKELAGCIIIA